MVVGLTVRLSPNCCPTGTWLLYNAGFGHYTKNRAVCIVGFFNFSGQENAASLKRLTSGSLEHDVKIALTLTIPGTPAF